MAKKQKLGTILSPDTFYYVIPFDRPDQKLTREVLSKHYSPPKGRRAYMGIHTEFKGFKNGLVHVEVKLPDHSENMLFLHVGLVELDVACTCGMPDEKLCHHAYMGLHSLAWYDYLQLDRYYWPGITSDEKVKHKFLTIELKPGWITVKPKLQYGNIFKADIGFNGGQLPPIEKPSKIDNAVVGEKEAIAYCLAYNVGNYSNSHLPVLMPCLGVTNKYNTEVSSFILFGREDKPITNLNYTTNQQQLNTIGLQQYQIAKGHDDLSDEGKKQALSQAKQAMITLWEQAIPLLSNEKYTYRYYTHWIKYMRDKPRKANMQNCRHSLQRPVLSFLLKFNQDHFSLRAVITVNGNTLQLNHKPHLFVIDEATDICYLMYSVQDDELLMWMLRYHNRLTVLREHFAEFHLTFLEKISSCYEVLFYNPKSKKNTAYSYEIIANEIINRGSDGK